MSIHSENSSGGAPLGKVGMTRRSFIRLPAENGIGSASVLPDKGWFWSVEKLAASAVVGATIAGVGGVTHIAAHASSVAPSAMIGRGSIDLARAQGRERSSKSGEVFSEQPAIQLLRSVGNSSMVQEDSTATWHMLDAHSDAINASHQIVLALKRVVPSAVFFPCIGEFTDLDRPHANQSLALERALQKVESFAALPPRWAGDQTQLPPEEVREAAAAFLRLLPLAVPMPHISPGAEGNIGFEWETHRDLFVVEFCGNALIWHHHRDRVFQDGEETEWAGEIPWDLLDQLEQSFG